jgi:hypothetical protein
MHGTNGFRADRKSTEPFDTYVVTVRQFFENPAGDQSCGGFQFKSVNRRTFGCPPAQFTQPDRPFTDNARIKSPFSISFRMQIVRLSAPSFCNKCSFYLIN